MPRTEAQRLAHNRRAARYRDRHRDAINARARAAGPRSPTRQASDRIWRAIKAEELAAYQRAYYAANRERKIAAITVARRERRRADPETARREARQHRLGNREAGSFADVLLADPCAYCGARSDAVDHIVARSAGGDLGWGNLTGACGQCNSRKFTRSLLRFLLAV